MAIEPLSDRGKEIKINELDSSAKDDNYVCNFTGKAKWNRNFLLL